MTTPDRRVAAIATGQLGAFTRTQAHQAGLSDRQLSSRVQSGFLTRIGPNAFRVSGAPSSCRSDLSDLLLDVGEPAWVAGPTAAALHGFDGFALRRPFHLLIPAHRNVRRNGVTIHRSEHTDLVDTCRVDEFPATTAARTIIDLARSTTPSDLLAAVDSALRDGRASEAQLHRRIVALRSSGRFGVPALLEVLEGREFTRGGESWLEREYLRLLAQAGLPTPDTQRVLSRSGNRAIRVDCHFPGTNLVVELLGYRYHRTRTQMATDADRLNLLIRDGFLPYQFTYDHVVDDAPHVLSMTQTALALAGPAHLRPAS